MSTLTVEEPLALAEAIAKLSQPNTLVVVDCLTLWLTNVLMPPEAETFKQNEPLALAEYTHTASLLIAIENNPDTVVLVGNEIGQGVIPMGREVRAFVDALGRLNQDVASVCQRVTLMAAGLPLHLKDSP
jgi:adenosylcobinamide kinase/adenosylcobinamide-phosphate guanylyltransferase